MRRQVVEHELVARRTRLDVAPVVAEILAGIVRRHLLHVDAVGGLLRILRHGIAGERIVVADDQGARAVVGEPQVPVLHPAQAVLGPARLRPRLRHLLHRELRVLAAVGLGRIAGEFEIAVQEVVADPVFTVGLALVVLPRTELLELRHERGHVRRVLRARRLGEKLEERIAGEVAFLHRGAELLDLGIAVERILVISPRRTILELLPRAAPARHRIGRLEERELVGDGHALAPADHLVDRPVAEVGRLLRDVHENALHGRNVALLIVGGRIGAEILTVDRIGLLRILLRQLRNRRSRLRVLHGLADAAERAVVAQPVGRERRRFGVDERRALLRREALPAHEVVAHVLDVPAIVLALLVEVGRRETVVKRLQPHHRLVLLPLREKRLRKATARHPHVLARGLRMLAVENRLLGLLRGHHAHIARRGLRRILLPVDVVVVERIQHAREKVVGNLAAIARNVVRRELRRKGVTLVAVVQEIPEALARPEARMAQDHLRELGLRIVRPAVATVVVKDAENAVEAILLRELRHHEVGELQELLRTVRRREAPQHVAPDGPKRTVGLRVAVQAREEIDVGTRRAQPPQRPLDVGVPPLLKAKIEERAVVIGRTLAERARDLRRLQVDARRDSLARLHELHVRGFRAQRLAGLHGRLEILRQIGENRRGQKCGERQNAQTKSMLFHIMRIIPIFRGGLQPRR